MGIHADLESLSRKRRYVYDDSLVFVVLLLAKEYLLELSFTQDRARLEAIKRAQGGDGSAGVSSYASSGGGRAGGGKDHGRCVPLCVFGVNTNSSVLRSTLNLT